MKRLLFITLLLIIISTGCIYLPSSPGATGTGTGQAPAIASFNANPESISAGSRAQLSWEVTGATSVTIDNGIGSVALKGTRTVVPALTTNYILTATNQYGTNNASAQVLVSGTGGGTPPPASGTPVITSFTASPENVAAGGPSTLSWNVVNATAVSISPMIGSVNPTSGSGVITVGSTTTYVLTATNAAGSKTASVTVTVAGSSSAGFPAINSFTTSPAAISSGGSSTLSWNVSGAAQVNISGIGAVDSVGSHAVSPAATTNYTLTATSTGGSWVTQTITVTVGTLGSPPLGRPDLVVQSISRIETSSGSIIGFQVKNIGTLSADSNICRLFAEGDQKASVTIPAMAAGTTYDGSFTAWTYTPLMPHIKVTADVTNIVSELDETNNEKSVTMAIAVVYDFVTQASSPSVDVSWVSGSGNLSFPGAQDDPKGFACYRTSIALEDNNVYDKVLETHPEWIDNGMISGTYLELYNTYAYKVKAGEHFYARCGFIKGASAGKVRYSVRIRCEGGPNTVIFEGVKAYDGTVKVIDVDLTPYAGKKADFILQVSAEGSSGQDWAVWEQARIIR